MSPEHSTASPARVAGATVDIPRWTRTSGSLTWIPGARRLAWFLGYGLPSWGIRMGARTGDPIARMTASPDLRSDPYEGYNDMRGPDLIKGRFVLATVSHATSRELLRSPDFAVGGESGPLPKRLMQLQYSTTPEKHLGPLDAPSMLALDGDLHVRYRRLVTRAFAAKNVRQQEDRVREIARELLDAIEADGVKEFDVVERFAAQLPVAVIADMLGIPQHMKQQFLEWGDGAAITLDPDLSWKQYTFATRCLEQLHSWFADHIERLRREPDDSLLGRLAAIEGPEALGDLELRGVGLLLLGAGFETTVNLIGNGIVLLDQNPDQLALCREDPSRWLTAADEALRLESPVQLTFRVAMRDTELAGRRIRKGTGVIPFLAGANRDPEVFVDPDAFDVTRANAGEHLALSHGAHYCIGANLARLEGAVAFETLYERFPSLRVGEGARRRPNRVLRGWEYLPVSV